MVKPKKREKVRNAVSSDNIANYFTALKQGLDQYSLTNQSAKIWNVDETGISLDYSPPKILSRRGGQLSGTPCNFADPLIVKLFSKP
jgi:hypothetical protein